MGAGPNTQDSGNEQPDYGPASTEGNFSESTPDGGFADTSTNKNENPPSLRDAGPNDENTNTPSDSAPQSKEPVWQPKDFPTQTTQRACPSTIQLDGKNYGYTGNTCAPGAGKENCSIGCQPDSIATGSTVAPSGFFAACTEKDVYCVGSQQKYKTITEAFAAIPKSSTTARILIQSGRYLERIQWDGYKGDLTIEGESNDATSGVRWFAPPENVPQAGCDATLCLKNMGKITLRRLSISGMGHGLWIEGAIAVTIDQSGLVVNLKTGATLSHVDTVSIEKSYFLSNGGNGILRDPRNQVAVTIDQSGRVAAFEKLAVTIDQSGRIAGFFPTKIEGFRFGLLIDQAKQVDVSSSIFSWNGAGGMLVSSGQIAVTIDQSGKTVGDTALVGNVGGSQRILTNDAIGVTIDQSGRVVNLRGNLFRQNGPMGRSNYATGTQTASDCNSSQSLEGGQCHTTLSLPTKTAGGEDRTAVAGVGLAILGMGKVEASGNSFFGNDAIGMVVNSANEVSLQNNAFERNGVRPQMNTANVQNGEAPGAKLWNIHTRLHIEKNTILDHLTEGLWLSHGTHPSIQGPLNFELKQNHFAGTGRFLPEGKQFSGNGIHISAPSTQSVRLTSQFNFFTKNRRAGFSSHGYLIGKLEQDWYQDHPYRALAIHETFQEISNNNRIEIRGSTFERATGYGVQIYGGGAKLLMEENVVGLIVFMGGVAKDPLLEADGINLWKLIGGAEINRNTFYHTERTAVMLSNTGATMEGNTFSNCANKMVNLSSKNANAPNVRGPEDTMPDKQKEDLQNRKNLGE